MVLAIHRGQPAFEIVEREDGHIGASDNARRYFDEFKKWPKHQRQAIRSVIGRVLDIGCGALQNRGHEVVGIDTSPLAVKVCRERGALDVRVRSITQVSRELGKFDTILMMGSNFGLLGGQRRAKWLLRRVGRPPCSRTSWECGVATIPVTPRSDDSRSMSSAIASSAAPSSISNSTCVCTSYSGFGGAVS